MHYWLKREVFPISVSLLGDNIINMGLLLVKPSEDIFLLTAQVNLPGWQKNWNVKGTELYISKGTRAPRSLRAYFHPSSGCCLSTNVPSEGQLLQHRHLTSTEQRLPARARLPRYGQASFINLISRLVCCLACEGRVIALSEQTAGWLTEWFVFA